MSQKPPEYKIRFRFDVDNPHPRERMIVYTNSKDTVEMLIRTFRGQSRTICLYECNDHASSGPPVWGYDLIDTY